jgi:NADH:ubiquinone oxidoreductase subunit H
MGQRGIILIVIVIVILRNISKLRQERKNGGSIFRRNGCLALGKTTPPLGSGNVLVDFLRCFPKYGMFEPIGKIY